MPRYDYSYAVVFKPDFGEQVSFVLQSAISLSEGSRVRMSALETSKTDVYFNTNSLFGLNTLPIFDGNNLSEYLERCYGSAEASRAMTLKDGVVVFGSLPAPISAAVKEKTE